MADYEHLNARIAVAFAGERQRWRTVGGVARTTGLSPEVVETYIRSHPQEFRQARLKLGGEPLYTREPSV